MSKRTRKKHVYQQGNKLIIPKPAEGEKLAVMTDEEMIGNVDYESTLKSYVIAVKRDLTVTDSALSSSGVAEHESKVPQLPDSLPSVEIKKEPVSCIDIEIQQHHIQETELGEVPASIIPEPETNKTEAQQMLVLQVPAVNPVYLIATGVGKQILCATEVPQTSFQPINKSNVLQQTSTTGDNILQEQPLTCSLPLMPLIQNNEAPMERIFKCNLCGYQTDDAYSLICHHRTLSHIFNKSKALNCKICNFYTWTTDALILHYQSSEHKHFGSILGSDKEDVILTCNHCSFTTMCKQSYFKHRNSISHIVNCLCDLQLSIEETVRLRSLLKQDKILTSDDEGDKELSDLPKLEDKDNFLSLEVNQINKQVQETNSSSVGYVTTETTYQEDKKLKTRELVSKMQRAKKKRRKTANQETGCDVKIVSVQTLTNSDVRESDDAQSKRLKSNLNTSDIQIVGYNSIRDCGGVHDQRDRVMRVQQVEISDDEGVGVGKSERFNESNTRAPCVFDIVESDDESIHSTFSSVSLASLPSQISDDMECLS